MEFRITFKKNAYFFFRRVNILDIVVDIYHKEQYVV